MADTAKLVEVLDELSFKHKIVENDDGVSHIEITVDEADGITVEGMIYDTEDGSFLRLLAYVDDLREGRELDQLALLMGLNMDIPTGAFCLDEEEAAVLVTVNIPLGELTSDLLGWVVEFLLVAQQVYFDEFYGPEEEEAQS